MTKINLIREYFLSFNSLLQFIIVFEFVLLIVIFISFLCFNWMYYNNPAVIKCRYHIKQLPIFNKIFVIWFSIFYAIPNKILINHNLSQLSVTLFIFLIIAISNVFASFILLYLIFWVFVLESYFFAVFYENTLFFRKFMDNRLFKGNEAFAKEYFSFFWGNMTSKGSNGFWSGFFGTVIGGLYQVGRHLEKNHVRVQGSLEAQNHIRNAVKKPETVEESLAILKMSEDHVEQRDTYILKHENQLHDAAVKGFAWLEKKF